MINTILAQLSFPPPPPTKPMTTTSRSSRKALYAAIIIAVVAVAVLVPVFLLLIPNMQNSNPATASSLKFTEIATYQDHSFIATFYYKNLRTPNMMGRFEGGVMENMQITIVNGAQRKIWHWNWTSNWMDQSSDFENQWGKMMQGWNETETRLKDWKGGDITYTDQGYKVRMFDIQINPALDDSLFTP
jgi:hypothetical protein